MAKFLVNNNAQSTLAGAISNSSTTILIAPGTGVLFPAPAANEYVVMTLTDAATGLIREIVHCTNITGDTLTVTRAQEGTTAVGWLANDPIANLCTAGQIENLLQLGEAQSQDTNYAADTGSPNAYVVALDPVLAAYVPGMPIRVKINAGNTNTVTNPTLNAGPGAVTIVNQLGGVVQVGQIAAGAVLTFVYDGTNLQLQQPSGVNVVRVNEVLITATGTYTPSPGMVSCTVKAKGGGGGSGGCKSTEGAAAGGGEGSTCEGTFTAAQIGASQSVTIGAGGTAGNNTGTNGGAGGTTSFGALLVAPGGSGGGGIASTTGLGTRAAGGVPTTGTVKTYGQPSGAMAAAASAGFGGAGGGPGGGGYTYYSEAGIAGLGYMGGGASGACDNTDAGFAGAIGAPGCVIVIEFIG
jgi:hypothetical protein